MTRVLRSRHAEDVGGRVIEPGQPIPDDADEDVVKRLESDGLIADDSASSVVDSEPPKRRKREE